MLVVGCHKNTTAPEDDGAPVGVTDEQSAIKDLAVNDEFVKNDELTFADQEVQPTDYGYLFGKIDAAIIPLRWGRFISGVTRDVNVRVLPGDTTAIAHVRKVVRGTLKIKGLRGVDTILVEKPFSDQSDRNMLFKRVDRNAKRYWRNWIPIATSLVEGGTPNGQIEIKKIEMITPGGDIITITDPQNFYLRYRWLGHRNGDRDMAELRGGDSTRVRVTLESASPDTDLVALRFGFNSVAKNRARMFLTRQDVGGSLGYVKVFERTFYVHSRPGHFHAGIDAATKATLFDDDPTKYSVSWWGIPYRVF